MRVVIAEDEALLRQGLTLMLREGGFDVEAAVADADELEQVVTEYNPEIVITDIRMPPTYTDEGMVAALHIRATHPQTAVMVLSQYVQRRYARQLLGPQTGGIGYLLKQRVTDADTFCSDLRRIAAGETVLDPEVVAVMMDRARLSDGGVGKLTSRQREVLTLMAEGRSNAWIAAHLFLSEKAIVQHTSNIYETLGLPVDADDHRRVLAVIRYLAR
ncbi:MAG: response regulator transcription factor [Microbacteriaceae bacterium]